MKQLHDGELSCLSVENDHFRDLAGEWSHLICQTSCGKDFLRPLTWQDHLCRAFPTDLIEEKTTPQPLLSEGCCPETHLSPQFAKKVLNDYQDLCRVNGLQLIQVHFELQC